MLLVTTFVELRVVAGRILTRVGRPHTVSGRPMQIYTCHAALCRGLEKSLSERHGRGMAQAWHGAGAAWHVNQTRPHCVNQMGKTQSKPLAARKGRGTAWYVWIILKDALPAYNSRNLAACYFATTAAPVQIISELLSCWKPKSKEARNQITSLFIIL
jgi:hypothetical protein